MPLTMSAYYMVGLAQLVSASGCGPEGRGFESHISPQKKNEAIELYPKGQFYLPTEKRTEMFPSLSFFSHALLRKV